MKQLRAQESLVYSIGGSVVYSMAQALARDGIFIDLIFYIDPHTFVHNFNERPPNVGRIVAVNSMAWVLPGKYYSGDATHTVDTRFHLAAVRQWKTLAVLAYELTALATAVTAAYWPPPWCPTPPTFQPAVPFPPAPAQHPFPGP